MHRQCLLFSIAILASQACLARATSVVLIPSSSITLVVNNSTSQTQGNVIVNINGVQVGPVCDSNWTTADAQVVCRQLGYNVSVAAQAQAFTSSAFGSVPNATSIAVMSNVLCYGNEIDLSHCQYVSPTSGTQFQCSSSNYAGVSCLGGYVASSTMSSSPSPSSSSSKSTSSSATSAPKATIGKSAGSGGNAGSSIAHTPLHFTHALMYILFLLALLH